MFTIFTQCRQESPNNLIAPYCQELLDLHVWSRLRLCLSKHTGLQTNVDSRTLILSRAYPFFCIPLFAFAYRFLLASHTPHGSCDSESYVSTQRSISSLQNTHKRYDAITRHNGNEHIVVFASVQIQPSCSPKTSQNPKQDTFPKNWLNTPTVNNDEILASSPSCPCGHPCPSRPPIFRLCPDGLVFAFDRHRTVVVGALHGTLWHVQ